MPLLVRSLDRLRADSWGGILSLREAVDARSRAADGRTRVRPAGGVGRDELGGQRGAGARFWLSIWLSHVQAGGRLSRDGEGGDPFWRHGSGPLRADVYDLRREPGAAARQDPTGEVSR